jgi:hypothetical protein
MSQSLRHNEEDVSIEIEEDKDEGSDDSDQMIGSSSEEEVVGCDDLVSEVDMRTSFVLSSNVIRANKRRKKILA